MNEEFSVSVCVYHGDDPIHFKVALDSLIHQSVVPNEIVLTVDGVVSCEIEEVIEAYEKELKKAVTKFNVVRIPTNVGHGEARRVGLENCSNDLVALMDADDISAPSRFEQQIEYMSQHPNISVVGGNIREFISVADPSDTSLKVGRRIVPCTDSGITAYMRKRCPLNQVTVMFRKKDVDFVGGYLDWYCEEDYYLWLRLYLAGKKFGNIDSDLVHVRVGQDMYQRRGGLKYFRSEAKLQKYMLEHRVINFGRYLLNVTERLIVQVLTPNRIRGWVFQKFARS